MLCVYIEYHPMIGVDPHAEAPPPPAPPVPVPMQPHLVGALLNWIIPANTANTVHATFANARVMKRGTDIQSLIPHIPLTPPLIILAPAIIAFSGSKSHFGPRSVLVDGDPVACAQVACLLGFNLNCGDIPFPSGYVIAPNTVVTDMTWADIAGGIAAMVIDSVVQAIMNKLLGGLGPIGGGIVGALLGSPLGFSFNANGTGAIGLVGRLENDLTDWVRGEIETRFHDPSGPGDKEAVAKKVQEENESGKKSRNPLHGTKLFTDDPAKPGDFERLTPNLPPPIRILRGILDNPATESF